MRIFYGKGCNDSNEITPLPVLLGAVFLGNYYEVKLYVKSASFSTDNSRTSRLSIFYRLSNHKNFILKYLGGAFTVFA